MTTMRLDRGCWDDVRDGTFFRLTAHVLSPAFCAGATSLLASYDDEQAAAAPASGTGWEQSPVLPAGLAVPRRRGA